MLVAVGYAANFKFIIVICNYSETVFGNKILSSQAPSDNAHTNVYKKENHASKIRI